jgi:hypothetical protein
MRRALGLGVVLLAAIARADADELPVELQAQLLSKMTTYVKGLAPEGAKALRVLVLYPATTPDAPPTRAAQAMTGAVTGLKQIGTLTAEAKAAPFTDQKAFEALLAAEKPQVVYLTNEHTTKSLGFVAPALKGRGVLSVTGTRSHLEQGVVLGFAPAEGRPKVMVNLKQAREQGITFHNGLLRYAVIVEQ